LRSLGYLSGSARLKASYTVADDPKNLISVDRDLHRCVDLYQRGDLAGAVALARRIVRERPGMSIAYQNLGFLLRQAEQAPEALSVYSEAVRRGVADDELVNNFALALCESGRAPEAVRLLESAPGREDDPERWNALGVAQSDSGRPKEALDAFGRALAIDPENVESIEDRGIVHLRAGNLAAAGEDFRRALAIDAELPRAWNGLGVALARSGDESEAIRAWTRAVALDPRLYDALFNLGLTAGRHGMRREARDALRQFVATAPRAAYAADLTKARQLLRALEASGS
jgi:Flp pilus assembly protein TadD